MTVGKINKIQPDRGFGFIKADDKDYFFHTSQCVTDFRELEQGDRVRFELDQNNKKGPRAKDVERF